MNSLIICKFIGLKQLMLHLQIHAIKELLGLLIFQIHGKNNYSFYKFTILKEEIKFNFNSIL